MIEKIKRNKKKLIIYTSITLVAFLIGYLPTGYYCMMPGNIISLGEMIEVDSLHSSDNSFNMTTVTVVKASLPVLLFGKLAPNVRIEPEGRVIPEGWTEEEYNIYSKYLMTNSHNNAKLAAADYLDLEYIEVNQEPYILRVVDDGPSAGKLQSGDTIVSIDDIKTNSIEKAREVIKSYSPGDVVEVIIERSEDKDSEIKEIVTKNITLGEDEDGEALLGVNIITRDKQVVLTDYDINIKTGSITGPSAGAMITMEILNKIGAINLPDDVAIAGTGTINADGTIGSIGGINQKIVTAFRRGINIYFVPESNADDILIDLDEYKDMKIVYVENMIEIIEYINMVNENPDFSGFFYYYYRVCEVLPAKF
ncbi:MAG: S16 family serine protease [Clostridia bacterium]